MCFGGRGWHCRSRRSVPLETQLGNQPAYWNTESGETMKAAGLKDIATVVFSTAVLIKSKKPSNQALVDLIASRIRGVISMYSALQIPFLFHLPLSRGSHSAFFYYSPLILPTSRPEICSLPIQRSAGTSRNRYKNHTWQAGTYNNNARRPRLGSRQLHGREEANRE